MQKNDDNNGQLCIFFLDERRLLILEMYALGHCRTVNNNASNIAGITAKCGQVHCNTYMYINIVTSVAPEPWTVFHTPEADVELIDHFQYIKI